WKVSDEFERANGNTYREYELALPRELSRSAQVALVQRFAEQELGAKRPYQCYGADKEEAARTYKGIRERWAKVQNLALEHAGVEVRVDHRSLAAQGIHREPEVHRGPAVSGIEG